VASDPSPIVGLPELASRHIVGMRVDATSYSDAATRISAWAVDGGSRYVCIAAVNNVIASRDDAAFRRLMNDADLVTPDGKPLAWALRLLGVPAAQQVAGTRLTGVGTSADTLRSLRSSTCSRRTCHSCDRRSTLSVSGPMRSA